MSVPTKATCIICISLVAGTVAAQSNDFTILKNRVLADTLETSPGRKETAYHVRTIQADGSWRDINYDDHRRSNWTTAIHLERLLGMACAHEREDHPLHDDPELRMAVHNGLNHWLENRYTSQNWWFNVIRVPTLLGKILIVFGNNATQDQRRQVTAIMSPVQIGKTGQNRVWQSTVVFLRGLLEENATLVKTAATAIQEEIRVTTREGIQPDFSFHQHGPQQQFGNYGLAFANSMAWWVKMLDGTSFRIGHSSKTVLNDYLLKGLNWVVWNGVMDISSCGRQLTSPSGKGKALSRVMQHMATLDSDNKDEYRAFIERNSGKRDSAYALHGNRHFWRSDYMVHRRPHYFASVRMCSVRVRGTESGNGQNLKGYHLGDGATFLYMRGDEYHDIMPCWNWRKLPGVTCHQTAAPLPVLGWNGYHNKSDFVGGVSDGKYGAACMHYNRDGLTAKKAWFFMDTAFVCLGTDIVSTSESEVVTTVEQSLAAEETFICRDRRISVSPEEPETFDNLKWVINGRAGYLFPEGGKLTVSSRRQRGRWKTVTSNLSNAPVEKRIFTVSIEHGTAPQGAKYAYVALPGVDKRRLAAHAMASDIQVVRNDSDVQAVTHMGLGVWLIVFHSPGSIRFSWGRTLAVNEPCLVIVRSQSDTTSLSVADPTQSKESLVVSLDNKRLTFQLPQDGHAGSTLTRIIR